MNIQEALDYMEGVTFENYMGGGQINALKDGKPHYIVCEIGCACGEIASKNAEEYGDALVALLNGAAGVPALKAACEAAIAELIEDEHQASTRRVLAQLRAALDKAGVDRA